MYTKNKTENPKAALASFELESCMEGADVYASATLYNLSTDPGLEREDYVVKSNWYRPDLIATEYYGDVRYEAFVILQAGSITNIKPGAVLRLVKPEQIKSLRNGTKAKF